MFCSHCDLLGRGKTGALACAWLRICYWRYWFGDFGAWRFAGVDDTCGGFDIAFEQVGQGFECALNGLINCNAVVERRFFEHPMDHVRLVARVSNAQAQSPILIGAELCMNVPQTVVPGMATAEFEFGFARCNVQLVVDNQNFLGLDFEKIGQCGNRFAAQVHESLRRQQPHGLTVQAGSGNTCLVAFVKYQVDFERVCECLKPPKSGIVAGLFVVWPRISEANKESDHDANYAADAVDLKKRPTHVGPGASLQKLIF